MTELYDDIAVSTSDPLQPTAGWGTLEENEGKYWLNSASKVKFYHNGTGWVNYDSAFGMAVSRSGITLIGSSAATGSVVLENGGGNLIVNGTAITGGSITTGTVAEMIAIPTPATGAEFLISPTNKADSKFCFYNGDTWQVSGETFQTQSAEALPIGSVVENDPTTPDRVRKATVSADRDMMGVVVFTEATGANQNVSVAYAGRWDILCESGSYDQTDYIETSSTDGQGQSTSSTGSGVFARPLEITTAPSGGGLVKCILFNTERF